MACFGGTLDDRPVPPASPDTEIIRHQCSMFPARGLTGADPRFDVERKPSTDQSVRLEIFEKGKDGPQEIPLPASDPVLEEIDEFADCILTGRPPETDGPAALKALALIRAAIESQRTGRPVDVNTVL